MFKLNRRLILKLAVLCVMVTGFFVVQNNANARSECPICPWPYHCNWWEPEPLGCVCDCPNPDGTCPAACA